MASTVPAELNEQQALEAAKFLQAIAHPKRLLLLAVLSNRQLIADFIGLDTCLSIMTSLRNASSG